ncbi:hypothetical protein [Ktedonobacter racemifer]|uniref:Uncharacterized protein n=1 Tax=Ktedonobacter racemifer DSM 44963 TaxID=485913 RepID=D6TE34_KTERA|nr:hypothetical protein [Ktedonobacter racemifer]EFH88407.1 hypothetical protein Krac_9861 [Ktedonobacter racemifer DSM 44963]
MESKSHPGLQYMQVEAELESKKVESKPENQIGTSLQLAIRKGTPQQHLRPNEPCKIEVKHANFYYRAIASN